MESIKNFLDGLDDETLSRIKSPVSGLISEDDGMFAGQNFSHYWSVGLEVAEIVYNNARKDLNDPGVAILDFASGFGRGTRFLRAFFPEARLYTSDLLESANSFCESTFGSRSFASHADYSSLEVQATFDVIWVGSLATHLSEKDTHALLAYLSKSLKADGILIISSHGSYVKKRMREGNFYGFAELDKLFVKCPIWNHFSYKDYPGQQGYGISIISKSWWVRKSKKIHGLCVKKYYKQGWDEHQDVVVLQKIKS
jgi:SAM-dependent methyltransferase